jgi:hypothetical protein
MDTFFLPQYAVPACILDKQSYQSILEDKRKIASSIADSVELPRAQGATKTKRRSYCGSAC